MPRRKKRSRSWDRRSSSCSSSRSNPDEQGTVKWRKGEFIRDGRYEILGMAGKGTFGTVLEVYDEKYKEKIALKVVRSVRRYLEAAYVEVEILERIREHDRDHTSLCVRLVGAFTTRIHNQKHVCIAFEKLGMSVYEFLRTNSYRGFEMDQVSEIGLQIVHSVAFCHSIGLTHTDLKPENVLLKNDKHDEIHHKRHGKRYKRCRNATVRVIDFGGATFKKDHHSKMINTRQYRAPEVILGLGWDEKSDIWSVGCILAELYTGELLFGTHEDIEHLALMEKTLGVKMPESMVGEALRKFSGRDRKRRKDNRGRSPSTVPLNELFDEDTNQLSWPKKASGKSSVQTVNETDILEDLIPEKHLTDCIRKCLVYDPDERITAEKLKSHPLFQNSKSILPNKRRK